MMTLPATNGYSDGQSVLLLDDAAAAPALARLRGVGGPKALPKIAPASVHVTVENGSGVAGAAGGALGAARRRRLRGRRARHRRRPYRLRGHRGAVRAGRREEGPARARVPRRCGQGRAGLAPRANGVDVVVVLGRDFSHVSAPVVLQADHAAPIAVRRPATGGTTSTTGPPANPGGPMPAAGARAGGSPEARSVTCAAHVREGRRSEPHQDGAT